MNVNSRQFLPCGFEAGKMLPTEKPLFSHFQPPTLIRVSFPVES